MTAVFSQDHSSIIRQYFPLLSENILADLNDNGKTSVFLEKGDLPRLLPEIKEKIKIKKHISESSFNTGIETLFIHRETEYLKDTGAYFRILSDIRSLEGIQYYSQSREKNRVLFEEAYPVKNTDSKKIIKTPEYNKDTENYSFNTFIKDSTFGKNFYTLDYTVSENCLVMKMTNIDSMNLGFIPVIGKGDLTFYLIVISDQDELAIYCSGICDTVNTGFLKKKIELSIYNRVIALYDWFIDNLKK